MMNPLIVTITYLVKGDEEPFFLNASIWQDGNNFYALTAGDQKAFNSNSLNGLIECIKSSLISEEKPVSRFDIKLPDSEAVKDINDLWKNFHSGTAKK